MKPRAQKKRRADIAPRTAPARTSAARVSPEPKRLAVAAMCAALALVTVAVFWGVLSSEFVHLDDNRYVTQNARVLSGLSWDNVKWAFSTNYFGFYYPVTWVSHMLDVQFYGLDAGRHHMTSLVLHVLNTLLLFLSLMRLTRAFWRSSLVAWLFAIHPLHVESVAWISERKDVLSALFWFLCLLAYARYSEKPSFTRYLPVFASLLLGLMSKSMLVTLPFSLLLLDYWPLGRWPMAGETPRFLSPGEGPGKPATAGRLLAEKLPLFALVPVFSALTWISQMKGGAVVSAERIPLTQRAANALISYATYVAKMLSPIRLAVLYPHPRAGVSFGLAALSGLALLAATVAVLWFGRRRKYLPVGWFWYLGTLVPVIGLVQAGYQARADRYTYVSLIGLFVALSWGLGDLALWRPAARPWIAGGAIAALLALLPLTRHQVGYWSNTEVLLKHALAVTARNPVAHTNLGVALFERGKKAEAIDHFEEALRIDPGDAEAHNDLGNVFSEAGRLDEAVEQYREALKIQPGAFQPLCNLGLALFRTGRLPEAIQDLEEALRLGPVNADAEIVLGEALVKAGRPAEAVAHLEHALAVRPGSAEAHETLGLALDRSGRTGEAIGQFQQVLQLSGEDPEALNNLGLALAKSDRLPEAVPYFQRAVAVKPDFAEAYDNLGLALAKTGRLPEAAECFRKAVELRPDFALAREHLAIAQAQAGGGPGR